jgi:amino acid transporter
MKGFGALFVLVEMLILVGAIFVCVGIGFLFVQEPKSDHRTRVIGSMGILVIFLMLIAFFALSGYPTLDFVDRCRPSGTGLCIQGQPFKQVENEITSDLIRLYTYFVFLPVLGWVGLQALYLFLMRAWQKGKKDRAA